MRDKNSENQRLFNQTGTPIETIIQETTALLQGNFWPICGTIGGVLLFFAAAVIVPP